MLEDIPGVIKRLEAKLQEQNEKVDEVRAALAKVRRVETLDQILAADKIKIDLDVQAHRNGNSNSLAFFNFRQWDCADARVRELLAALRDDLVKELSA